MNPQSISLGKRLILLIAIAVVSVLLIKGGLVSGIAQAPEEQMPKERVLEDTIPNHVPIKIRIKKEKENAFKDLNNDKWARDFELEVTNVGEKPIYSLSLLLVTDLRAAAGFRIVAPLHFGMLGEVTDKAGPDDVPIKPGETYIFKIHPGQLNAWDKIQLKEHRAHPKKIQVKFEVLSFGDGTGLVGEDGEAIPRAPHERSGLNSCGEEPNKRGPLATGLGTAPPGNNSELPRSDFLPASFLPVNFLESASVFSKRIAIPTDCCSSGGCLPVILFRSMPV